ncbi:MAG TPA: DUF2461 domain-containing protein [Draconibacterium sp.]|nr:DUF2461 domain-containing protein [Draconibacterium sp.]
MIFKGFSETGIVFLKDLAANNKKEWFEQNRHVYEEYILTPLKQLATDLQLTLKSIDTEIETTPAINKTISKIYRDTRFSSDKSPFRTIQWLSFKRPAKTWGNVPEFYFYFTPEKYEYGMGFYSATPQNMERIRSTILYYPEKFEQIIDAYRAQDVFVLEGESYKKAVPNSLPEKFQEWIQKKNLYLKCEKEMDENFFSVGLKEVLEKAITTNVELYQFLIESIS